MADASTHTAAGEAAPSKRASGDALQRRLLLNNEYFDTILSLIPASIYRNKDKADDSDDEGVAGRYKKVCS
jgi:hypothetical protein